MVELLILLSNVSAAQRTTDSAGDRNSENTGIATSAKPKPVTERTTDASKTANQTCTRSATV